MPALSWRGGTPANEGNFGVKENWVVTSTGITPASAPASSDTLTFDSGNIDVDDGLTTGLTGVTIVRTKGYTGRIAPASYLGIAVSSLRLDGSGVTNLSGDITAGSVRTPSGSFGYGGGTATSLTIESTPFAFAGAAIVTAANIMHSQGSDLNNATGYTTLNLVNSTLRSKRAGKFILKEGSTLYANTGCDLSTGTQVNGRSRLFFRSAETVAGTVEILPYSTLDVSGSAGFVWSGTLIRWTDANINLDAANGTVVPSTVTAIGFSQQSPGFIPVP